MKVNEMLNLQKYYDPNNILVFVELGKDKPMYFYYNRRNNISKYDYRTVKKIFNIDYSIYDFCDVNNFSDFMYKFGLHKK